MSATDQKYSEDTETKERQDTKTPSLYRVFLLNDDYTTMEFVIHVLEKIFHKQPPEAMRIMLHVHKNGRGLAGIYTKDIAETKIAAVHELAAQSKFPLKCSMEKE
ncbi:MAG: ATP-dependent Clp protease adapter ClpS [Nitrospirae bacterium]|nr:MAG: ATP-dependent Clp protease adapter ClpS [Nitrospirota bacterium]